MEQSSDQLGIFATVALFPLTHEIYDHILPISRTSFRLQDLFLDALLTGALSALNGANGNQITYNGHPLYTYSGDTAPGQTTGAGLFGKWFVCTPGLPS